MKASIVDLRYKMKDVLAALDRNEEVTITYRGKVKGVIKPVDEVRHKMDVKDHPFFNSDPDGPPVEEVMKKLRGGRYRDL